MEKNHTRFKNETAYDIFGRLNRPSLVRNVPTYPPRFSRGRSFVPGLSAAAPVRSPARLPLHIKTENKTENPALSRLTYERENKTEASSVPVQALTRRIVIRKVTVSTIINTEAITTIHQTTRRAVTYCRQVKSRRSVGRTRKAHTHSILLFFAWSLPRRPTRSIDRPSSTTRGRWQRHHRLRVVYVRGPTTPGRRKQRQVPIYVLFYFRCFTQNQTIKKK